MKQLIVTADDFGLSAAVNEAIDEASRKGILTAASLMVTGEQASDAVERAKANPTLGVGLHVVLVDGLPALQPDAVPDLVDDQGRFSSALVRAGVRFFFSPRVRRQLAAEIRAQFEAFAATGLELDHVNAHHHMHLHPTVADLIIRIGRDFGLAAIRVPDEPALAALCTDRGELKRRSRQRRFLSVWSNRLRRSSVRSGLTSNDVLFGLYDSGQLNVEKMVRILAHVPDGITEIMIHPAKSSAAQSAGKTAVDPGQEEFRALLHPRVNRSVERFDVRLTRFGELARSNQ